MVCRQPQNGRTSRTKSTTERTQTTISGYADIGTINAGTIKGKIEEVVDIMQERNLKVLGVAETRLQGQGRQTVHTNCELIYSGSERDTRHGIGIFFDPDFATYIEKVHYISNRIIASTLNIKITVCHSSKHTRRSKDGHKKRKSSSTKAFRYIDIIPNEIEIIVMGDLNGHVGSRIVEGVIGNFGVVNRNEEGEMLIDFCVRNNLAVMNTYFKHEESHHFTWYRYNSRIGQYDLKTHNKLTLYYPHESLLSRM